MEQELYKKMDLCRRIVNAKLFIDKFYYRNIDLDNIADEAYFSKYHFIRLFKEIYGQTPHHYLSQTRIENAKLLLLNNIPVYEVSEQVGFESSTSFTALFKKLTGMTPSIYQAMQHRRHTQMKANPFSVIPNCFTETHGWTKNSNIQEVG